MSELSAEQWIKENEEQKNIETIQDTLQLGATIVKRNMTISLFHERN